MSKEEALQWCRDYLEMRGEKYKPIDDWITVSTEWDMNVWTDDTDTQQATLYPVVNGATLVTTFYNVKGENDALPTL